MKYLILLIVICFTSCSKSDDMILPPKEPKIDTAFKIEMLKCPNLQTVCFFVNSNDTMTINVRWVVLDQYYFFDTLHIKKGSQIINTNKLYYGIVPFKF